MAYVVLRPGAELEPTALEAHCRAALAGYKVPAAVEAIGAAAAQRGRQGAQARAARAACTAGSEAAPVP